MKIKEIILKNRILYTVSRSLIDAVSSIRLHRFISYYKMHKEEYLNKLIKENRIVIIKNGKYNYGSFSGFYLNNMIGLTLDALMSGFIPIIKFENINDDGERCNCWEDLFAQPCLDKDVATQNVYEKSNTFFKPAFDYIFSKRRREDWCYIYNEFVHFNYETNNYIQQEIETIIGSKKVLGVICRGTDYVRTKPKYHPIQPNIETIINDTAQLMRDKVYDALYLATEDESYYQLFVSKFGKEKVLTNKRTYYDKLYSQLDDNALLYQISFDRNNDQFLKGREYLSSIYILSKCDGLIGGHCGGSDMAIYFNNNRYNYLKIYDIGVY